MAIYNEILAGRFNRALQKLTGIKGPPVTPQLSSEIMPILPLFFGAENRYLEGWNLFGATALVTAVAAVNSAISFRNPVTSGVVAVVELCTAWTSVADTVGVKLNLTTSNADFAVALSAAIQRVDARMGPPGLRATIQLSGATSQGGSGLPVQILPTGVNTQPAVFIQTDTQEIPLLPGDALLVLTQVVNTNLDVNFRWRERPLEDSEKT